MRPDLIAKRQNLSEAASAQQARAIDPGRSVWVAANAGTGKTKVLVDRALRLLLAGTPPRRILCLTYTRAAAAEMETRLKRALGTWAVADHDQVERAVQTLLDRAPTAAELTRARTLFATVLEDATGLRVQTIHAFCQSVLTRFPVEAGLAPHFQVLDDREAAAMRANAAESVFRQAADDSTLETALKTIAGYSDEDSILTCLKHLIEKRAPLIAALAAGPLTATLRTQAGLADGEDAATVLARMCAVPDEQIMRDALPTLIASGKKTDQKRAAALAPWLAADQKARIETIDTYLGAFFTDEGDCRKPSAIVTKATQQACPDFYDALLAEQQRLDRLRASLRACHMIHATEALLLIATKVIADFESQKKAMARLDYDDLIARVVLLLGRETAPWVLYKLDGGIDHLLLDEAQDTSPGAWRLIEALADAFFDGVPSVAGADSSTRTLFVVGDDKQSIYSFQGADRAAFDAMRTRFSERAAATRQSWQQIDLQTSFRSSDAVLAFVDHIFAEGQPTRVGVVGNNRLLQHQPYRTGHAGRVEVWPNISDDSVEATTPWDVAVEQDNPPARVRLATAIARTIADWVKDGRLIPDKAGKDKTSRPVRFRDIIVLVRRRNSFVHDLVRAFKAHDINTAGVDRMALMAQLPVMDLVALGHSLLLPEDDLTLATSLRSPLLGLSEDSLFLLARADERDRKTTLWQRLQTCAKDPGAPEDVRTAYARLKQWRARVDYLTPFDLYAELLDARGGRGRVLSRLGRQADDPINEFLSLALDYQHQNPPSLQGFLHWVQMGDAEVKRDMEQGERDEVRILTVHGAKGLEAPIVFLPDTTGAPRKGHEKIVWGPTDALDHDPLPFWIPGATETAPPADQWRKAGEQRQKEEYHRLLYVALTRASDELYICGWTSKRPPVHDSWYALIDKACQADLVQDDATQDDTALDDATQDDAAQDDAIRGDALGQRITTPVGPGWALIRGDQPPEAPLSGRQTTEQASQHQDGPPPWLFAAPPVEPSPTRPLTPSRPPVGPDGEEPPARSPFDRQDDTRFLRGILVHRLLQTLPDRPAADWSSAARRYLEQAGASLSDAQRQQIVDETLAVLQAPELAELWGPGSLAEVPITGRWGDVVVSGQIDRLLVTGDRLVIADYKTNRPPPRLVEDVADSYLRQMALYRALLADIYPGRDMECLLVWTDGLRIMALPDDRLDQALPKGRSA